MTKCYLCSAEADVSGQDYGRRKIIRCTECGYYEVTNSAITKLENTGMTKALKADLSKTVKLISESDKNAEIIFEGDTLSAREKQEK